MNSEFNEFLKPQESSTQPPQILHRILNQIEAEQPRKNTVALHLGSIHLISSLLTLFLCPQFGLKFGASDHGLMYYFMHLGDLGCYFLCGGFYMSLTFIAASLWLHPDEWIVIKKSRWLFSGGLVLVSFGALNMLGTAIEFYLGLVWILGAIFVAQITLRSIQPLFLFRS